MLEISQNLFHKLSLHIVRHPDSDTEIAIADLVKGVLCDQLSAALSASLPWHIFAKGGTISKDDGSANGRIASFSVDNEHQWALSLRVRDPSYSRRRWIYYIGLREQDEAVRLYYAKCCYDHMAGSVSTPRSLPDARDTLLDALFYQNHFQCLCGKYPFPVEAALLTHSTLPDFINYLQDESRSVPLILVTCPWRLSPQVLQDRMLGNAIIYWCEDSAVVMRMNSILPGSMYTAWDSVRVFVPLTGANVYHPIYTAEDIRTSGVQCFISGLCRAFCQSFRSEDVRSFVTIDDVFRTRDKYQLSVLQQQNLNFTSRIAELERQCDELRAAHAAAADSLAALQSRPDLAEYEALLGEMMQESESLKSGISDLAVRLYSCNDAIFKPDASERLPQLQELSHAIRIYLSAMTGKR